MKRLPIIIAFLCMLFLATGSVVLSCATGPMAKSGIADANVSVNTGPTQDGRLFTVWVFDRLQSVVIVDSKDRSRKIELARGEWRYDPGTTELSIERAIPFKDYFASIDGSPAIPHSFVLNGIKDPTDLMVIIGDRLAIEGYDYAFDQEGSRLTFRNDVSLKDPGWSIHYSTPYGGAMLGDWKPENADRMSYLEAEHRMRWLRAWYDRQTAFWFLDEAGRKEWEGDRDRPPALVRRAATPQELADMKAAPVNVVKFRSDARESDLSREVGFDARVPRKLEAESPRRELSLAWRTIEEHSQNGKLIQTLDVVYEDEMAEGLERYAIDIKMRKPGDESAESGKGAWLIDEETVDLGLPVHVVHEWGMQVSDIEAQPSVARITTWEWTEGSIVFRANGASGDEERTASLLGQFIAARLKRK